MEKELLNKHEILRVEFDGMRCEILTEEWRIINPASNRLNDIIADVIYRHCSNLLKSEKGIYNHLAFLKQYLESGFNHYKHNLVLGEVENNYYVEIIKDQNGELVYFNQADKDNGVEKLLEDADTWAYQKFKKLEEVNNI